MLQSSGSGQSKVRQQQHTLLGKGWSEIHMSCSRLAQLYDASLTPATELAPYVLTVDSQCNRSASLVLRCAQNGVCVKPHVCCTTFDICPPNNGCQM